MCNAETVEGSGKVWADYIPQGDEIRKNKIVLRTEIKGVWHEVRTTEIQSYLTKEFYEAYRIYRNIKELGVPNGQGWNNEPSIVLTIWELFHSEVQRLQAPKPKKSGGQINGRINSRKN